MRVQRLPLHHHDPFDRAIVAHAALDGFTLATSDAKLKLYEQEAKMIFC
jgi:PIN domain nuclease of toxin-antitoxin system